MLKEVYKTHLQQKALIKKLPILLIAIVTTVITAFKGNSQESQSTNTTIVDSLPLSNIDRQKVAGKFPIELYNCFVSTKNDSIKLFTALAQTSKELAWSMDTTTNDTKEWCKLPLKIDELINVLLAFDRITIAMTDQSNPFTQERMKQFVNDTMYIHSFIKKVDSLRKN